MIHKDKQIWAIVPAAGIGKRMLTTIPKQYLLLNGEPILQLTLKRLLSVPSVKGVVVALNENDGYWKGIRLDLVKPVIQAEGGAERCDSVINAMQVLSQQQGFDKATAWVLVHDSVRPCVSVSDIENLISEATLSPAGGLLAAPVRDTMKRQNPEQNVAETVDRTGLWHALTPQLFPYETLLIALTEAGRSGVDITDEASAMEFAGFSPRLVTGSDKNIKITRPEDLEMAEYNMNVEDNK